jgi:hypothetical protein
MASEYRMDKDGLAHINKQLKEFLMQHFSIFEYAKKKNVNKENFRNIKDKYPLLSNYIHLMRFEVLMAVIICSTIFCVVMPCSLVEMYCLHLQV